MMLQRMCAGRHFAGADFCGRRRAGCEPAQSML
jgi:hypothetical protein